MINAPSGAFIFLEYTMAKKAVGSFGFTGWATTPEDMLKELLKSYRCANANEGVVYKRIKSLAKSWQLANHDPELLANYIAKDLDIMLNDVFDKATVTCSPDADASIGGSYGINIGVIINEGGKSYDLHSVLASTSKSLFEDYDQTYFDFKF